MNKSGVNRSGRGWERSRVVTAAFEIKRKGWFTSHLKKKRANSTTQLLEKLRIGWDRPATVSRFFPHTEV